MKRLISLILTLCVILGLCAAPASALTDLPTLKAESAILIDLRSGDACSKRTPIPSDIPRAPRRW